MSDAYAAADLADGLISADAMSAEHRPAFLAAAREWFAPARFWYKEENDAKDVAVDRVDDPDRWMSIVYSNRALVTQFDDGETVWPNIGHRPTSSASMPSVVAGMLKALDVHMGHSVLEIGTGTGWNAALLAEIVGENGRVSSVEIDPTVAEQARRNLDAAGYGTVETVVADAAISVGGGGRFDRIIATVGVHVGQLPYAWVEAVKPGGVVVAPMRADMASGPLVRFVANEDGTATGHAVPWLQVGFMDMRTHRVPAADLGVLRWDDPAADLTATDLAPWVPLLADDHRWPIAVALSDCRYDVWERTDDRPHGVAWLCHVLSGSWASVVPAGGERYAVRQYGPRRLWDEAEAAYRWWQRRGQPPLSAWRWTITPERQSIMLDGLDEE
ncbi:methyltransferase domain-containing protein [Amycolatopsis sp. BJA-103]|uniref:methyltransferase domain-containing protein n=1 Tax=Amycolatopsis sp. BJA-103 TaxID=1911175 RepID=UPI001E4438EC|nr:methyltransferase domain-containing protein [Amycolatopsis sp. BJA-103]